MNIRQLFVSAALVTSLGCAASASAIEGFPGSTWGEIRQDIPNQRTKDGPYNVIGQGYVEQGVDWVKFGSVYLNTYGTVRYYFDTMHYDWNNYVGPGAGVALTHISKNGNYVRLGVEHNWQTYYNSGRVEEKTMVYVRWFQSWNLK